MFGMDKSGNDEVAQTAPIVGARRDCILGLLGALAGWGLTGSAHAAANAVKSANIKAGQRLLVVGDSLSAEYGLKRGSGWVALLDAKLKAEGHHMEVTNASISGDTTSGGRSRLPALLAKHQPSLVVLELGGNDALRGLPLKDTRTNLLTMVQACQATGAKVVLVGVQVPPNYGRRYTEEFAMLFSEVSQQKRTALVPSLLKGVADDTDPLRWFQADRIHPKEEAQPALMNNVWTALKPLLGHR